MVTKKGTLCVTFDNMGNAAEVGKGICAGPSEDELDIRIGYPNTLKLLDELDLTVTFFIEGWNALHHPDLIKQIADRGHEVALHGWTHEAFSSLNAIEAERAIIDAQAAFRLLDIEPLGFRAPGGVRGTHTAAILQKLGIKYDSSVDTDAVETRPYLLEAALPTIPWQWPMVDYFQYHMHPAGPQTPLELERLFSNAFDETANCGSFLTVIFHANTSGIEPSRLEVLERLLVKAKAMPDLEIKTASQIADSVRTTASTLM